VKIENTGNSTDRAALYVVATPIGNLSDITLRALEVLKAADVIAAEDTRVTARLLQRHGIAGKLMAAHEHNERGAARRIIDVLAQGRSVALVSDAGTPGIADPGAAIVAAVRAAGHPVVPIPGANAAAAALSVSGLAADRFLFCGFLPARAAERRRVLQDLAVQTAALVFYEAPHRVADSVADLCAAFGGERDIVIARELTKIHETVHCCRLQDAATWILEDANRERGEFVLVVQGAPVAPREAQPHAGSEAVLKLLLDELPLKQAVTLAARITGAARNGLYARALELQRGMEADEH